MNAESECSNCNVARILKTVTPVARRCRMRSFECPKCRSVLRIVAFGGRFAEKAIDRTLAQKKRCGGLFPCLDAGIEQGRPKGRALRHNCWRIYYGNVHVGTIAERVTDNAGQGPAPL